MADIIENEGFGNDLVSVVDENGVQHTFEELDRIETDEGRFIALLPVYSEAQDIIDDDGELIILSVVEDEDGEVYQSEDLEYCEIDEQDVKPICIVN